MTPPLTDAAELAGVPAPGASGGALGAATWSRVAPLRPRLRAHAHIERHVYRGEVQHVLVDGASRRVHRFDARAHAAIALMDGRRTVAEIAAALAAPAGETAMTPDALVRLLAQLHQTELLLTELPPDVHELAQRRDLIRSKKSQAQWLMGPITLRIPLWDPQRALDATAGWWRVMYSVPMGLLWLLVVGGAAVAAVAHFDALTTDLGDRVMAAENLLLLALVFPLVKAAHEWGHAAAVHRFGGEVHELGVMMLVFFPVPYVDASAANAFAGKWQRALVGAAGMAVELFLASIALFVWLAAEPGWLRATCFNVMLIAGVSTVLFNGNPLLKYDGYYILADLLEMPNLKQRANRQWSEWFDRRVAGLRAVPYSEPPARRPWLLGFGAVSGVYRVFVSVSIIVFVGSHYPAIGLVLALWAALGMLVVPSWKGLQTLVSARYRAAGSRRYLLIAAAASAVIAVVGALPLPSTTSAHGIVWVGESAVLRAGAEGTVTQWLASPGQQVKPGDALLQLDDPMLLARLRVAEARRDEQQARLQAVEYSDPTRAQVLQPALQAAEAEVAALRDQLAALRLHSPVAGELVVARAADLAGRFVKRGQELAYVRPLDAQGRPATLVRVVVHQRDIDRIRTATRDIEVLAAGAGAQPLAARIERAAVATTDRMPNAALTLVGGGPVLVDPTHPHTGDTAVALERWFLLDLAVPDAPTAAPWPLGQHVQVRFALDDETLWARGSRWVRQQFLTLFNA